MYGKKNYVPMEFIEIMAFNSLPPNKLTPDQVRRLLLQFAWRYADRCSLASSRRLT